MVSSLLFTIFIGAQLLGIPENVIPGWLNIFKEYPILNQGSSEGVKNSFAKYSQEPHCAIVIAKTDNDMVAGIATGLPLLSYYETFASNQLFQKSDLEPSHYYLFNDLIILPQYRNQGVGSKLCKKLEKKAKLWGYKALCTTTIEHDENNPLKPAHYKHSSNFWQHVGFTKTSLKIKESWPTIVDAQGNFEMREHTLAFWIKELY